MKIDPTLIAASCATLEQAINHSLSLDSCTQEKLANYAGRVIQLRCTQPELTLYFRIDSSISVLQYFEDDADAGIQGTRGDWLALLTADDLASALINGKLVISGDTQLFMALKSIAEQIELDWEGQLATFIGDIPAHLAGRVVNAVGDFSRQTQQTARRTLDDFLHEEARLLPAKIECENFYQRLRTLEMKIDRIDAKIKRQQKSTSPPLS